MPSRFVHDVANGKISSLWSYDIPFYICVEIHTDMHTHTRIFSARSFSHQWALRVCLYLPLQITLRWAWGCTCLFKLVLLFSSDEHSEVGLQDHMVALSLILWRNSILFCIVAAPIYISTNCAQGFPSLHILNRLCFLMWRLQRICGHLPQKFVFTFHSLSRKLLCCWFVQTRSTH